MLVADKFEYLIATAIQQLTDLPKTNDPIHETNTHSYQYNFTVFCDYNVYVYVKYF